MPQKLITLAVLVVLILPLASSKDAAELETYLDCAAIKKVDIVFVFDTTNSMGGEISELRAVANKFATGLEASNIDFQLGLVEFRDFPKTCDGFSCGSPGDFAYQVKGNGTLTSDIFTFSSWLKELKAGGGGSPGPEAVLTALRHAVTDMTWRPDAEKTIIVLTDAGPHPDGSCCNAEGDTLEGTVFTLTDQGARVYVIGPDDASLKQIAANTGGQFYEIRSGLSLKPLLEEITLSMSCSFNAKIETICENKQLEAKVQLVGEETIPYMAGQTEVWMYLDQAGSISRYNLSFDPAEEVYKAEVPDVCGPVDMTVYGRVGERSAAQTVHVECGTCGAAAAAEAQESLSISGRVFDDSNEDGVKDVDEAGLEGWDVLLEGTDGYSATGKTDRKGFYIFTGLTSGSYRLAAEVQENWTATADVGRVVELVDAHASEIYLGFKLPARAEANQSLPIVVVFPDPNLEAAIRATINKLDGNIYATDLEVLDVFGFNGSTSKAIKNITGLEYCINLTDLYLTGNQITDVSPLSELYNLRRLFLDSNQISDISPLEPLDSITWLELGENQITDVSPLSKLDNLRILGLDENQITDVSPLSKLDNLRIIKLNENQITDVSPLSGLNYLVDLHLDENQITDVSPLSKLDNLRILELGENQISDISPLSGLNNLEALYLDNNQISDISPLSGLNNLVVLYLINNQITDVSPLSKLDNLSFLELGENQISDISPLSGLNNLEDLRLDENQITDVSPLSGLNNLTTLWIRGNQITDVSPLSKLDNDLCTVVK